MPTLNSSLDGAFFAQFLDDYFAECDEHLMVVRRNMLAIESFVNQPRVNQTLLDELFRSFHTLKGLSGMVGVSEAEQIAHEVESYLKTLRQAQTTLSPEALGALMAGTQMLEQVIGARSMQRPCPDIRPVMARLMALSGAPAPAATAPMRLMPGAALTPEELARLQAAFERGASAWHITFVPSAARAERGVDVNSVRARLQSLGELVRAIPRVVEGGIVFDFLVAGAIDEASFAEGDDGLSWAPYEPPPAEPPPADPAEEAPPAPMATSVVRVELTRLDDLMRMVGELVISRARLEDHLTRLESSVPANERRTLQETSLALERQLRELRHGIMRVRMVPIRDVFARMQFVVRDVARESGKQVRLHLSGEETEIDKYVVERMLDPLLHLVRNAVSHGLEPADERGARGKPLEGTIVLRAATAGDAVVIEVEDDGRGVDVERVTQRAHALDMIAPGATLDASELVDVLCAPGFSTRDEADMASGRGVGMAVVKTTVQELGGTLALDTAAGHGSRFTIQLPLTLAIVDALIVAAAEQTFAVPMPVVREVIEVQPSALTRLERNEILGFRGRVLPLVQLGSLFGSAARRERAFPALVIGDGTQALAIGVDRIVGKREIVVRAITDPLCQVMGITGATELGDGRVVLILDVAAIGRATRQREF